MTKQLTRSLLIIKQLMKCLSDDDVLMRRRNGKEERRKGFKYLEGRHLLFPLQLELFFSCGRNERNGRNEQTTGEILNHQFNFTITGEAGA